MGWILKMDEKGRVVIPREVRGELGLQRGTNLILEVRDNELILLTHDKAVTENSAKNGFKDFLSSK
jgi:AbrB family looped-hinge helix DNA binding protein